MHIAIGANRTHSNPTAGVNFTVADQYQIDELVPGFQALPDYALGIVRSALAREIIWLEQVSDWTAGPREEERRVQFERALIAYQATTEAIY